MSNVIRMWYFRKAERFCAFVAPEVMERNWDVSSSECGTTEELHGIKNWKLNVNKEDILKSPACETGFWSPKKTKKKCCQAGMPHISSVTSATGPTRQTGLSALRLYRRIQSRGATHRSSTLPSFQTQDKRWLFNISPPEETWRRKLEWSIRPTLALSVKTYTKKMATFSGWCMASAFLSSSQGQQAKCEEVLCRNSGQKD